MIESPCQSVCGMDAIQKDANGRAVINQDKCVACGQCLVNCPFGAINMKEGRPELNAACKGCGICVKNCPEKAILKLVSMVESVD